MSYAEFTLTVKRQFGLQPQTSLMYRISQTVEYGSPKRLVGPADWGVAMKDLKLAAEKHDWVELHIFTYRAGVSASR